MRVAALAPEPEMRAGDARRLGTGNGVGTEDYGEARRERRVTFSQRGLRKRERQAMLVLRTLALRVAIRSKRRQERLLPRNVGTRNCYHDGANCSHKLLYARGTRRAIKPQCLAGGRPIQSSSAGGQCVPAAAPLKNRGGPGGERRLSRRR
jgi:hypothetical protein